MTLVANPVPKDIGQWRYANQIQNGLHTEELDIQSVASGYLKAEAFCIPDLDCRVVGALIFHCCGDRGVIESWTKVILPHVFQDGPDTCVHLTCWDINPKVESVQADVCWNPDPCARAYELRCCQMEWLKEGKKKRLSWRDRDLEFSYLSEDKLCQLLAEAEAECEFITTGQNSSRCLSYRCHSGYC